MKKYFHSLTVALILSLPFVSCGDDPDDEPNPNPTPTPTAQLSSIEETSVSVDYDNDPSRSNYKFEYNELNKIKRIRETDINSSNGSERVRLLDFSWNPFSLIVAGRKFNVTLSSAGYIASAQEESDTEFTTFEYDDNGHLIRKVCKDIDYYEETTYTWKDNLLVEFEENYKEGKYSGTYLYTVSYGNEQNKTGIWPASFWECELIYFEPGNCNCPYVLQTGLLGVAPTRLPISATIEYISNWSGETSTRKYKISPQLDSNGRLSSEIIETTVETGNRGKYNYSLKYNYR